MLGPIARSVGHFRHPLQPRTVDPALGADLVPHPSFVSNSSISFIKPSLNWGSFFFRLGGGDCVSSFPNRNLVLSEIGNRRAVSPFTSTTELSFSRWAPSPWAIFLAASYSRAYPPVIFLGLPESPSSSISSSSSVNFLFSFPLFPVDKIQLPFGTSQFSLFQFID